MREWGWFFATMMIAAAAPVRAQVPVIDQARLQATQSGSSNTAGSLSQKPSTANASKGTACNVTKSSAGTKSGAAVTQGAVLNQLSGASDFAALPTVTGAGDGSATGTMLSQSATTANTVATTSTQISSAVTANVQNFSDVATLAGTDDRQQDAWDRNTAARLMQAQAVNQAVATATAEAQLHLEDTRQAIVQQSQASKLITYDAGSSDPFATTRSGN
jgi:hypothetical protein